MTETPEVPGEGDQGAKRGKSKRTARVLRHPLVITPTALFAALCVVDVQTAAHQAPASCGAAQVSVHVPKPHVWLAGALTGMTDTQIPLRDAMAAKRPDVALTAVVAANATMHLSPMGNVPPTYGGIACLAMPAAPVVAAPAPSASTGKARASAHR